MMIADKNGSPTEQVRALAGWRSASDSAGQLVIRCHACRHVREVSARRWHCALGRGIGERSLFATSAHATCNHARRPGWPESEGAR